MSSVPVLFVSHEGTRTGAPMMLLHFLRWLRANSTIEPQIALLRGGPLADEFAEVGPTTVLGEDHDWPPATAAEAALGRVGLGRAARTVRRARLSRQLADLGRARAVYLNSTASIRLLHYLPTEPTAIAHVHELRSALRWSLREDDPPLLDRRIRHFVAAADCVADNLTASYGIDPADISRVYEFIDVDRVLAPPRRDRADIRAELGVPDDATVVGGCGFGDWRKGIDLFVQLARAVVASGRNDVHFVWVGDRAGGIERAELDYDIAASGTGDHLHLVGLQPHAFDWYRAFDVFALTSREDPYPLVGLETAVLEVPMVCFDAGGMTELVGRSLAEGRGPSGVVVPYLDVEAMAATVVELVDDPRRRRDLGREAAATVRRDHEVDVAGPQLLDVIGRVLQEPVR